MRTNKKNTYNRGYLAHGNTMLGFSVVREEDCDSQLKAWAPKKEVYHFELEDKDRPGIYMDRNYLMVKAFHPEGTASGSRPHYVSQCLVFEDAFKEEILPDYYDRILAAIDPGLDEAGIQTLVRIPVLDLKYRDVGGLGFDEIGLSLRERLMLIAVILAYEPGRSLNIDITDARDNSKKPLTEAGVAGLLARAFPRLSISVNHRKPVADLAINGPASCSQTIRVADLSLSLEKSRCINRVFARLHSAADFTRRLEPGAVRNINMLAYEAERYSKGRERENLGIMKMEAEATYTMSDAKKQYDLMNSQPEAKAALLEELARALEAGDLNWKRENEFIAGILAIAFSYSEKELAKAIKGFPIRPVMPYDLESLTRWVRTHAGTGLMAKGKEKDILRVLKEYGAER